MSIIAAIATEPSFEELVRQLLFMAVVLLPGLVVAWWARAHRASTVAGPLRVPDDAEMWPIPIAVVVALVAWVGSAVVYSMAMGIDEMARQAASQPAARELDVMLSIPPRDQAFLMAGTPLFGLAAAVGFLMLVKPAALRWIGASMDRLGAGVKWGAVAAVFAVPATMLVGVLTELTYQIVEYRHPAEHDLLKFMKEAPAAWIQWAAIAAAVLVAPLFEEFLFRGLVQTSLVSWLNRWGRQTAAAVSGFPVALPPGTLLPPPLPPEVASPAGSLPAPSGAAAAAQPLGYTPPVYDTAAAAYPGQPAMPPPMPVVEAASPGRRIAAAWLGILITSVVFAVIHPLWTAPIIFFLSLVLGYVYERTGNLWVSIVLHAIFNTVNTTLYLLLGT